jgi:predicted PurR-regulated permease PerM
VENLHNPSQSSLGGMAQVEKDTARLYRTVHTQAGKVKKAGSLKRSSVERVNAEIATLQAEIVAVQKGTLSGPSHASSRAGVSTGGRLPPNPQPQTAVPSSYLARVTVPVDAFASTYSRATFDPSAIDPAAFKQAVTNAKRAQAAAQATYHTMATTPILLLRSQSWLDQHNIGIDLSNKFGQAASQLSDQGTNILNNAITILSETANALLDFALILIISFYLLNDGARMIRRGVGLVPVNARDQTWFFISSLDKVLGGYIRGQLFLSVLAGILGGGGAAVLGVPYPLLIGIFTAILETVPVIGPMVAVVPAVLISLFFMPVLTTVELFIWFLVFQQIVTNVLGPRVMGIAVGINPLEAIVAVLVGYPLGGFLGAFLAVPLAGIIHILVREAYAYFVLGRSLPTAEVPDEAPEEETPSPKVVAR